MSKKTSQYFSTTYASTFQEMTTTTTIAHYPAGVIWTFVFAFQNDTCGHSMAGGGIDTLFTNSITDPPCCLPSMGAPKGPCIPDYDGVVHNLCEANQTLPLPKRNASTEPAICKLRGNVTGTWVKIMSRNVRFEVEFDHGVVHTDGTTNTKEWGEAATASISAGFSFLGLSAATTVSHTTSQTTALTNENLLANITITKQKYWFPASSSGGVAWQFQFVFNDTCGGSQLKTRDIAWTPDYRPPCCLPGYFKNASIARGEDVCLSANGEPVHDVCK